MVKQAERREISRGACRFCHGDFAKNKMTQHLKSCKARVAHKSEQDGQEQRLLHLLVEGKYRPDYWMHLEVPAVTTLDDLDLFLRTIWLDCCSHLSEFEIDGVSYASFTDDDWDQDLAGAEVVVNEADGTEELPTVEAVTQEISLRLAAEFHADLKDVPVQQIEERLVQLFSEHLPSERAGALPQPLRPMLSSIALSLQQGTLLQDMQGGLLDEEEDAEMDAELGDVVSVGAKFSYMYDFGSSSTLSLRVIAERNGVLPAVCDDDKEEEKEEGVAEEHEDDLKDEDEIVVLARNESPSLVCRLCGQPATYIPSRSEYDSLASEALCTTHARESEYSAELLPLVNSPRTGICAYMGDAEMDWDEDDWDEEEDEEEDEDEE